MLYRLIVQLNVHPATLHVQPPPPSLKRAVTSAIPTLILDGEYDPINPPANSARSIVEAKWAKRLQFTVG